MSGSVTVSAGAMKAAAVDLLSRAIR